VTITKTASLKPGIPIGGPLVAALAATLAFCGCAENRDALKKKIESLERNVMRLEAEKTNAVAKAATLDDERVVLEKKVVACDEKKHERALKVVRLRPEAEAAEMEQRAEPWPNEPRAKDDKRPVLTLVGPRGAGDPYAVQPAQQPASPGVVPPVLGGDNLGVVTSEGTEPAADGTMDEFHEAYRAYTNSQHDAALAGFSRFAAAHPDHAYADNALYWRGECLLAQGKLLQAVGEYERLLSRYPRSEKAPAALLRIGFVYDRLNDLEKASDYYFKVVDGYPGSDEARKASQRVAAIRGSTGRVLEVTPTSIKR
jgi:tol-pal system protein YbgF